MVDDQLSSASGPIGLPDFQAWLKGKAETVLDELFNRFQPAPPKGPVPVGETQVPQASNGDALVDALIKHVKATRIAAVPELARTLAQAPEDVLTAARGLTGVLGVIDGSPAVIFEIRE